MRTAAWEEASQIALRHCSKVAVGESQYIRFWWKSSMPLSIHFTKSLLLVTGLDVTMKGVSAFLDMRRCKDWDHKICHGFHFFPFYLPRSHGTKQIVSIQSLQLLSHVQLFVNSWTAACQASLSFTIFGNLLKRMFITASKNLFSSKFPQ